MARLLFLSHNLPYPPHAGVTSRTFNVLQQLAESFEIDLLSFHRRAYHPGRESVESAQAVLAGSTRRSITFPLESSYSRWEYCRRHLTSLLTGTAYTVNAYRSREFHGTLRRLLEGEQYDLIHVDSIVLSEYATAATGSVRVCTHHNVESQLLRRMASRLGRGPKSAYVRLQANRMETLEQMLCPTFAANIVVSESDGEYLGRMSPGARFEVIGNGVDCGYFYPRAGFEQNDDVVFVGGMTWSPNWDGLRYFVTDIWPQVLRKRPTTRFTTVGDCSASQQEFLESVPNVRVAGHVDDVRPYVWRAGCVVIPLRVGGGTRIKILDSWALGKAVISTPIGCEGLRAIDGANIIVRSDPQEFAAAVCEVLDNAQWRGQLGSEGRRTAVAHYDWKVLGARIRSLYHSLMRQQKQPVEQPEPHVRSHA